MKKREKATMKLKEIIKKKEGAERESDIKITKEKIEEETEKGKGVKKGKGVELYQKKEQKMQE